MTAEEFNQDFPVGTEFNYHSPINGPVKLTAKTRTPAWAIPSGHVLVSLEGKAGGVSLDALSLPDGTRIS